MFVLCSQAGTGAKAKNVFELSKEYKGVSWRYNMPAVLMRFKLNITFKSRANVSYFFLQHWRR